MSGGGSVNFQTPTPLYEAENRIFGNLPWNNVGAASDTAYAGIGNLTSPGYLGALQGNVANTGNALVNQVPGLTNAANGIVGNLFNNQQGYYNQLFQQNQDQANAENAMAGVATTPYGAALANQSGLNFNNQWQSFLNSQQNTAANTIGSLYGTAAGALGAGAGGIQQNANNQQQQIQDYLNYVLGNTQNSAAYTGAVNNSTNAGAASTNSLANAEQANNSGKSGIGSALGGIGKLIGGFLPGAPAA